MATCIDCHEDKKTIFDYRCDRDEKCCKLYVIYENNNPPAPTGFCLECLLKMLRSEFEEL